MATLLAEWSCKPNALFKPTCAAGYLRFRDPLASLVPILSPHLQIPRLDPLQSIKPPVYADCQ
jgi:hypothetical protein